MKSTSFHRSAIGYPGVVSLLLGLAVFVPWISRGQESPAVVMPLTNQTAMIFSGVILMANVSGTAPIFYHWYKSGIILTNGSNISGVDGTNLTISIPELSDAAQYQLLASNAWGTATGSVGLSVIPIFT